MNVEIILRDHLGREFWTFYAYPEGEKPEEWLRMTISKEGLIEMRDRINILLASE